MFLLINVLIISGNTQTTLLHFILYHAVQALCIEQKDKAEVCSRFCRRQRIKKARPVLFFVNNSRVAL